MNIYTIYSHNWIWELKMHLFIHPKASSSRFFDDVFKLPSFAICYNFFSIEIGV